MSGDQIGRTRQEGKQPLYVLPKSIFTPRLDNPVSSGRPCAFNNKHTAWHRLALSLMSIAPVFMTVHKQSVGRFRLLIVRARTLLLMMLHYCSVLLEIISKRSEIPGESTHALVISKAFSQHVRDSLYYTLRKKGSVGLYWAS